jgi:prephenate dehydrogenase
MEKIRFNKVTVIGVGLIGGSLAIKLKEKGLARTIVGVGRGIANLEAAKMLGVVDSFTRDVTEGVKGSDLVFVAVPVQSILPVIKAAAPHLEKGSIVTDVGSVKKDIVKNVESLLPEGVRFVGAHPVAGTENSGVEAAFSGLFEGRKCIITPTANTDKEALEVVKRVWEEAGSRVICMDAERHDIVLAAISHLPHMIAYSLVNTVSDIESHNEEILSYSAGGFMDFTRIASSSPEMWTDICTMNSDAIVEMIELFEKRLRALRRLIEEGDSEGLKREFERAKNLRDSLNKYRQQEAKI